MIEKRLITYLNKKCIIILKNKFKYEGFIQKIFNESLIIEDRIGDIEININSIVLIYEVQDGR